MSNEKAVENEVRRFVERGIKNIKQLTARELVGEAAINPLLVKALGINDFDSLARFYVYQRIGRSLVTSFGTSIEKMIRALSGGEKSVWWDIKALLHGRTYYMSVKSGPRDMNKDQVQHFARRARELLETKPDAVPTISMGYGKKPLGPIAPTLRDEGLDPDKYTLTGKQLYETITGQKDYHIKLLELTSEVALYTLGGKRFIDIIESKVKEISRSFEARYKTVDELLLDTF